jgi:hypothetical protein
VPLREAQDGTRGPAGADVNARIDAEIEQGRSLRLVEEVTRHAPRHA